MSALKIKWEADMWTASIGGEGAIYLSKGLTRDTPRAIEWKWHVADYTRPPDFLADGQEPTLERAKSKALAAAKPIIDRIEKKERELEERRTTCPECGKRWKSHDRAASDACWDAIQIRRARELIAKVDGKAAP